MMKREKGSKMRTRFYNLNVVKKNTTIESMQKDASTQMGEGGCVRELTSMEKQGCIMKAIMLSCK